MMLRFDNVSKSFNKRKVLDGMSRNFPTGLYALHGSNGIGKSTLLAILAGILAPDSGAIDIDGCSLLGSPEAAKAKLSFVPDDCPVYPFMRGRELLQFVAQAKRVTVTQKVEDLIDQFGMRHYLDTRFGQMSLGTQKKMMLAAAWIGEPSVLLLDEPSNGLDGATRDVLIARLRDMGRNAVVLMSTHDADFATAVGAEVIAFASLQGAGTPVGAAR